MATTTKTKSSTKSSTKSTQNSKKITREQIQERAFQIYLNRGDIPGNAESDWLWAEKELKYTSN